MTKARDIASAAPAPSTVSATELGYLDGVTSNIQTQIDSKTGGVATDTPPASPTEGQVWLDTDGTTADANFVLKSTLSSTGDIFYASSANNPARLGIGSTNQVLTVSGGVPTWATPAAGGKVLQVVQASTSVAVTNSTSTLADTGLSATITPTSTSSKILVMVVHNGNQKSAGNANNRMRIALLRGASIIMDIADYQYFNGAAQEVIMSSANIDWLDSPSTTSAVTYKTQFANQNNTASVQVQFASSVRSFITLMEIGA